jgi:hypothetical protein
MHYRNIIFVEAPLGEISEAKITRLVKQDMSRFEDEHWDGYVIGGAWPDTLNGKNIIPIREIRQQHLDDCFDIIIGGSWFEREIYRPWLPGGKMFARKPKDEMPTARWLRKEYKTHTGEFEYQFFAVAIDCHN